MYVLSSAKLLLCESIFMKLVIDDSNTGCGKFLTLNTLWTRLPSYKLEMAFTFSALYRNVDTSRIPSHVLIFCLMNAS